MSISCPHLFKNREEAANLLSDLLNKNASTMDIVMAIPKGGVPIGHRIAKRLQLKFDLAMATSIHHPLNTAHSIGAVSLHDNYIKDPDKLVQQELELMMLEIRRQLNEKYTLYMGCVHNPEIITGKSIIITDDGLTTGQTMLSAIRSVKKQNPKQIIVAVPVASKNTINLLHKEVNQVICPVMPDKVESVGDYYEDYHQISDKEVIEHIRKFNLTAKIVHI